MDLRNYRAQGQLRGGTPIVIRAIRPDDGEALREGIQLLSERTVYHRFFQAKTHLSDQEIRYLTELDFENHVGLVATIENQAGELVIGVARCVRLGRDTGVRGQDKAGSRDMAEVAFVVADQFQGQGVATQLLWHLVAIARALGIRTLVAEVLGGNRPMLDVFAHSGLPLTQRVQDGIVHVELALAAGPPP
jgi:GNAT superfamily N-acetyltransferase